MSDISHQFTSNYSLLSDPSSLSIFLMHLISSFFKLSAFDDYFMCFFRYVNIKMILHI